MTPPDIAAPSDLTNPLSRRWYILAMLALVYALNIADRFVMSTLIEPIKAELQLSDSAMAFLTGVALAVFYVSAGLPLATLADRTNRRNLVAVALGAWSIMTSACGFAQGYWQLLLCRLGVGVGEAGGTPSSHSLICDYFSWRQRAFALSVFSIGASIGSMIGSATGYISDEWGWRSAFFVLGFPGVVCAVVLLATVQEPQRGRLDVGARRTARTNLMDTWRFACTQPALLHCWAGGTVFSLWAWGLMWWTPSYLVRSHHMTLGAAGGALSLMHGVGGTVVLLLTSVLMTRLARCDARAIPWFIFGIICIATVPSVIAYTTSSTAVALSMLWIFIPISYANFGPTFALVQNLVPASMRAQSSALLIFFGNIANLIVAPQLVGFASDALVGRYGLESLRVALIPLALTGFWAAYHYWAATRTLREGLVRAGNAARP
jgi:predicted MFS family arabinose efflux permease